MTRETSSKKIFSVRLKHVKRKTLFSATVMTPITVRHFSKLTNAWHEHLESKIRISLNGKRTTKIAAGETWLGIVMSATELIRQQLPQNEEKEWVDEKGVESWVILPKTIQTSWGYELHQKLTALVSTEVNKFISKLDKKRRAYEVKKKNH